MSDIIHNFASSLKDDMINTVEHQMMFPKKPYWILDGFDLYYLGMVKRFIESFPVVECPSYTVREDETWIP